MAGSNTPSPSPTRVGLLIPSSNSTVEFEYNRFGPTDVSWHAGRLTLTQVTRAGLAAQDAEIGREAAKLGTVHPALTVLCQSAIGFVAGEDAEAAILSRIAAATGAPTLSAAVAMVMAVRALGARRIALATPFGAGVDDTVSAYFDRAGLSPIRSASLGLTENFALAGIEAARLIDLVRSVDTPVVDAIVLPGGNLRVLALIPRIESVIGKPIVITNQACIWAVAGLLSLEPGSTLGRLAAADRDGLRRSTQFTGPFSDGGTAG